MASTDDDYPCRDQALSLLQTFAARILPAIVRRIAAWKQIPRGELPDLTAELRQELALDCLQHAPEIVQLAQSQRHARWMRLAERWVYRYRLSLCRRGHAGEPDDQPAPPGAAAEPPQVLTANDAVVLLANGRCNLTASAARTGRNLRSMRMQLDEAAGRLGRGGEYLGFWRRRLGEAMTGLAADLLRDRGLVSLLLAHHNRPDPRARLRRMRRLAAHFQVRRATIAERRAMSCWLRRPRLDETAPRRLLEQAAMLCPQQASAWLWLFEACLLAGDLAAALRAIRACRRHANGPRCGLTLARARLLEARDRWPAAFALLRRAHARWPREVRLQLALAAVDAAG